MRHLTQAFFYWIRLIDLSSEAAKLSGRQPDALDVGFSLRDPCANAELYRGAKLGFVIYDAARDDATFDGEAVRSAISDGNMVTSRALLEDERHLRRSKRLQGRPKGSLTLTNISYNT